MAYFPLFVDLEGQKGLIVGGGLKALHKVQRLLPYGPEITVVAESFLPEMLEYPLLLENRSFLPQDISEDLAFVIGAEEDPAVNSKVAKFCRERHIPVNVVDVQEECSFLFPSLVQRGKLSVGISSSGASPSAAVYVKKKVQELLPDHLEEILEDLEQERTVVKGKFPEEKQRAKVFATLWQESLAKDDVLTEEEKRVIYQRNFSEKSDAI